MAGRANVVIGPMVPADWTAVAAIYAEGLESGQATFELSTPSWEQWNPAHRPDCRFVARVDGAIVGWAALTPVSDRCVYQGVGDLSVYVASAAQGHGVGGALLDALIAASEEAGLWTLQAGMFTTNTASIALHASRGFREVGVRERIGERHGRWRDVLLMERRSSQIGR